jgi:hypothetical protein
MKRSNDSEPQNGSCNLLGMVAAAVSAMSKVNLICVGLEPKVKLWS